MEGTAKKPITKQWWFWLIIGFLVIGVIGSLFNNGESSAKTSDKNDSQGSSAGNAATVDDPTTDPTTDQDQGQAQGSSPDPTPTPPQTWPKGMYKVGVDIPAGEYVIVSTQSGSTYFEVTSDSSGTFDSIICNDNFYNRTIITVHDGEYLSFKQGTLYAINDAPKVEYADVLPTGMYLVGVDIPAGEYKLRATSGAGYYQVSSNSSHSLFDIIANGNFDGEVYITVSDGQYLTIDRSELLF